MTSRKRYASYAEYVNAREAERCRRNRDRNARARAGEVSTSAPRDSHPWRRPYKNIPSAREESRAR